MGTVAMGAAVGDRALVEKAPLETLPYGKRSKPSNEKRLRDHEMRSPSATVRWSRPRGSRRQVRPRHREVQLDGIEWLGANPRFALG